MQAGEVLRNCRHDLLVSICSQDAVEGHGSATATATIPTSPWSLDQRMKRILVKHPLSTTQV